MLLWCFALLGWWGPLVDVDDAPGDFDAVGVMVCGVAVSTLGWGPGGWRWWRLFASRAGVLGVAVDGGALGVTLCRGRGGGDRGVVGDGTSGAREERRQKGRGGGRHENRGSASAQTHKRHAARTRRAMRPSTVMHRQHAMAYQQARATRHKYGKQHERGIARRDEDEKRHRPRPLDLPRAPHKHHTRQDSCAA